MAGKKPNPFAKGGKEKGKDGKGKGGKKGC